MAILLATCSYNGYHYSGWNIQPHARTIQGVLQSALQKALHQKITIQGASRTDKHVHAHDQKFVFTYNGPIATGKLAYVINKYLPPALFIQSIEIAPANFQVRNCTSKTYHFVLNAEKYDPLYHELEYYVYYPINDQQLLAMQQAAQYFLGYHNFFYFSTLKPSEINDINPYRTLDEIKIWQNKNKRIVFEFTAKSFIRHQIRMIVGCLLAYAYGSISLTIIQNQLRSSQPNDTSKWKVPGKGLHLMQIKYEKTWKPN